MAAIELPAMLTVEEEEEFDPADKYGPPIKKIIIVRFGGYEVARYELQAFSPGYFYFEGDNDQDIRYDGPEEFLANKLKKLFRLIG